MRREVHNALLARLWEIGVRQFEFTMVLDDGGPWFGYRLLDGTMGEVVPSFDDLHRIRGRGPVPGRELEIEERLAEFVYAEIHGRVVPPPREPEATLTEWIIGFRSWKLSDDGRLLPVGLGTDVWRGNAEVKAECHRRHGAPAQSCDCGFNCYFELAVAQMHYGTVVTGAVRCRGAMEVHRQGFRAQYAQPIALLRWSADAKPKLLGLPVVDTPEDLREIAEQYGAHMPDAWKPERVFYDPLEYVLGTPRRR